MYFHATPCLCDEYVFKILFSRTIRVVDNGEIYSTVKNYYAVGYGLTGSSEMRVSNNKIISVGTQYFVSHFVFPLTMTGHGLARVLSPIYFSKLHV